MLKQITITGADDSVNPVELFKLSKEFPIVEWGILLSRQNMGTSRFPSRDWLGVLRDDYDRLATEYCVPNLSLHLCGKYARALADFGMPLFTENIGDLWQHVQRVQINMSNDQSNYGKPGLQEFIKNHPKKQFILQVRDVNEVVIEVLENRWPNTAVLFDKSGGAGVSPEKWAAPIDGVYCGWAGGLGPDNLGEQLEFFHRIQLPWMGYWVDMESKVRTLKALSNLDFSSKAEFEGRLPVPDIFDLGKVRRCLEIAYEFKSKGAAPSDDIGVYGHGQLNFNSIREIKKDQ